MKALEVRYISNGKARMLVALVNDPSEINAVFENNKIVCDEITSIRESAYFDFVNNPRQN